jgi:hypothetical protein
MNEETSMEMVDAHPAVRLARGSFTSGAIAVELIVVFIGLNALRPRHPSVHVGIPGVLFGIIAFASIAIRDGRRARKAGAEGRGIALAGSILGVVSLTLLLLALLGAIYFVWRFTESMSTW